MGADGEFVFVYSKDAVENALVGIKEKLILEKNGKMEQVEGIEKKMLGVAGRAEWLDGEDWVNLTASEEGGYGYVSVAFGHKSQEDPDYQKVIEWAKEICEKTSPIFMFFYDVGKGEWPKFEEVVKGNIDFDRGACFLSKRINAGEWVNNWPWEKQELTNGVFMYRTEGLFADPRNT